MLRLPILALIFLLSNPAHADISGSIVAVHDGDTCTLLTADNRQVKIRLADIDAPEIGQAFGRNARTALSNLVFGKQITVTDERPDRYGRTVGRVTVDQPPVSASREMVRQGMAWVYGRYNKDSALPAIEAAAKADRRGLWHDPAPVPPWEWRRTR